MSEGKPASTERDRALVRAGIAYLYELSPGDEKARAQVIDQIDAIIAVVDRAHPRAAVEVPSSLRETACEVFAEHLLTHFSETDETRLVFSKRTPWQEQAWKLWRALRAAGGTGLPPSPSNLTPRPAEEQDALLARIGPPPVTDEAPTNLRDWAIRLVEDWEKEPDDYTDMGIAMRRTLARVGPPPSDTAAVVAGKGIVAMLRAIENEEDERARLAGHGEAGHHAYASALMQQTASAIEAAHPDAAKVIAEAEERGKREGARQLAAALGSLVESAPDEPVSWALCVRDALRVVVGVAEERGALAGVEAAVEHWRIDSALGPEIADVAGAAAEVVRAARARAR